MFLSPTGRVFLVASVMITTGYLVLGQCARIDNVMPGAGYVSSNHFESRFFRFSYGFPKGLLPNTGEAEKRFRKQRIASGRLLLVSARKPATTARSASAVA